jgi:hypothetical protein
MPSSQTTPDERAAAARADERCELAQPLATGPSRPGPVRPARPIEFRSPPKRHRVSEAGFTFFKKAVRRLMRPALAPIEDAIAGAGGWHAWRGGLDGSLTSAIGDVHLERRLRDELAYWVRAVRVPGAHEAIDPSYGEFHTVFAQWQTERCAELGQWLGVHDLETWQATTSALEIGGGPHPMIAQGQWRFAAAVDPLNDGYATCGLFPPPPMTFTPIAAPGERLPLASATFDLVVCDNCLDHVADPGRVVAEIARVLKPCGHAWILVDLRSTVDDMHPHAFTPELLATMLTNQGLDVVRQRIGNHASHPLAHGEVRVLARKRSDRPG